MNDLIMGVLFAITFVIIQFGLTTLIFMWYSYRMKNIIKVDTVEAEDSISKVGRFKPKGTDKIKDRRGKDLSFSRKVWK